MSDPKNTPKAKDVIAKGRTGKTVSKVLKNERPYPDKKDGGKK
jgi:hypothetical protein